jgi:hypothetical protein
MQQFQQQQQRGHDGRHHQHGIVVQGQPPRKPLRIIRPSCMVNLQPVLDWFWRLCAVLVWTGVAGLIVACVLHG